MLSPGQITREELYEAVWTDPVQKVAKALGLSDVGLAKIARNLNVPLPGRGYWAKGPMARKRLFQSLPGIREDQPTSWPIGGMTAEERIRKDQETRDRIEKAGIQIPTVLESGERQDLDLCLADSRELLVRHGLESEHLRRAEACVDVTIVFARAIRGQRWVYAVGLITLPSLYAGARAMAARELLYGLPFLVAGVAFTVASVRRSAALVGTLWALHGLYDLIHGRLLTNPGVPRWYPVWCCLVDVVIGAYLLWLSRRIPEGDLHRT
jgi:hypothetical protein